MNQVDALGLEPQNVIELFMPGIASSYPYRNYGDYTDASSWRPLELSQIEAVTAPNAWNAIGQAMVAVPVAGGAVLAVPAGATLLSEAAPLSYAAAWLTTLSSTATGTAVLKYGGTALSAYHLYQFATDENYAAATMSVDSGLGVSSVYIAGRNIYETGMGAARSLGARYPVLNLGNYQAQASPPPRTMVLGAQRGGRGPVLKGQAGVARAITELEAQGATLLGREITVDAGGIRTRPDLLIQTRIGGTVFVEVKPGSGVLTPNQAAAFPWIEKFGGIPRGGNAARAGLIPGQPLPPTPVRLITY